MPGTSAARGAAGPFANGPYAAVVPERIRWNSSLTMRQTASLSAQRIDIDSVAR